jgi:predicted GNAT family N-acyltransferase
MAVDKEFKNNRYSEQLLLECIRKTALAAQPSNPAAVIGLFVDAKEDAVSFYKQYGFLDVSCTNTESLYLPIKICLETASAIENG